MPCFAPEAVLHRSYFMKNFSRYVKYQNLAIGTRCAVRTSHAKPARVQRQRVASSRISTTSTGFSPIAVLWLWLYVECELNRVIGWLSRSQRKGCGLRFTVAQEGRSYGEELVRSLERGEEKSTCNLFLQYVHSTMNLRCCNKIVSSSISHQENSSLTYKSHIPIIPPQAESGAARRFPGSNTYSGMHVIAREYSV